MISKNIMKNNSQTILSNKDKKHDKNIEKLFLLIEIKNFN
jgi:hypothetical protein